MLFEWTEEKIEWYVRASLATGFHRELASLIRPALRREDHVVDFGCGSGLIDLEIAPYVADIMAADVDAKALGYLKREIENAGHSNIRAILGDMETEEGLSSLSPFDVALFCFFGGPGELLKKAFETASRLVIMIAHGSDVSKRPSKIGGSNHRAFSDEIVAWLDSELGSRASYEKIDARLEFGQPFHSLAEAERFFDAYAKGGGAVSAERADQINRQLALVEETGDAAYPYFFPNKKDTAIFLISKNMVY